MARLIGAVLAVLVLASVGVSTSRGDDKKDAADPAAILDKAIKALGGEEKLAGIKATSMKSKGKLIFDGNENTFDLQSTNKGLEHSHGEFQGEFGGMKIVGVTVLAGNKGWRKFNDMDPMEMDENALANEKHNHHLQVLPMALQTLKKKEFKLEAAPEEKVKEKPAVGIKVTVGDKHFHVYFDKESGMLVKMIATVAGFDGAEFVQETYYSDYKDVNGVKIAHKVASHRDGQPFIEQTIEEFKILDKVDDKLFDEPK